MSARSIAFGCLLGVLVAAVLRVPPARGAEPDLAARVATLEQHVAALQTTVGQLRDAHTRSASEAENLRLRMNAVEGYLLALQAAFAALAPNPGSPPPATGVPVVPDGRVDQMVLVREGRDDVIRLRVVSDRVKGLSQRGRFELAVSVTDADGLVRKTFTATTGVVDRDEVVWLNEKFTLSSDRDEDNWFRDLFRGDAAERERRIRNLVVKFQLLTVLPPPK
jgi:hypothetical protein